MKITNYKILYGEVHAMTAAVNEKIAEGWQPFGGVAVDPSGIAVQAMVIYDRSDEDQLVEQINDIHSAMVLDFAAFMQNYREEQNYPRSVKVVT